MTSTDVLVIGAGVLGLTCALELAERGRRVKIIAEHTGRQTTSYAAGAMVSPAFGSDDARLDRWAAITRARMMKLSTDPATGVRIMPALLASRMNLPVPAEAGQLDDVHACSEDELPPGFAMGIRVRLPFVAMPTYLGWLTDALRERGVTIEQRHVGALDEVGHSGGMIVNCTGLGARDLVNDDEIRSDRGQHVVVRNPGIEECFYEVAFEPAWAGWMVHGDVVVLGGVSGRGDERREPDPAIAQAILDRCAAIEPRFAEAEILEHRVGLRPARPSARLEPERTPSGMVVHCYGHGGMGVALSYGSAADVVDLVDN